MDNVLRMKEIETQKAATRNLTQCIFIQSIIHIHVFSQWSQFTILHYNLFHYTIADFIPYTPFHLHGTSHISPNMENQAFPAFEVKIGMQHSTYSSLSLSSLLFYCYSVPMLYRLRRFLYTSLFQLNPNSHPRDFRMLYSSENGNCIASREEWRMDWWSMTVVGILKRRTCICDNGFHAMTRWMGSDARRWRKTNPYLFQWNTRIAIQLNTAGKTAMSEYRGDSANVNWKGCVCKK